MKGVLDSLGRQSFKIPAIISSKVTSAPHTSLPQFLQSYFSLRFYEKFGDVTLETVLLVSGDVDSSSTS